MTVSIIIAVKTWQKNLEECVAKCLELDYPDFEIVILPDDAFDKALLSEGIPTGRQGTIPVKIIPTGPVSPAYKRDIALNHAQGGILAFLDDDAYPIKDWLTNAIKHFSNPQVAAVGGPAVTPTNDSYLQQVSGAIYSSILVSGNFVYRYLPRKQIEVDDYPSCNLLVRTSIMRELGGFDTKFWPGEDTKLCLDITKKLKKKIVYDPLVLVYHHRREVFSGHLKQISSYALHRGYFVKRFPETSLKLSYFLPSLFISGLIFAPIAGLFFYPVKFLYIAGIVLYLVTIFLASLLAIGVVPAEKKAGDILLSRVSPFAKVFFFALLVFIGIILTHITYGVFFIKGLILKKLPEEK